VVSLLAAAKGTPLLLVIDDLQWADESTLHLLRHVLDDPARAVTMVVATTRPEALHAPHPLVAALDRVRRSVAGVGLRRLELEGLDDWEGRGLHYFVTRKDVFKGKNCVIVGGGDSALDWTLGLQDTADLPITLIHRRDRFRALETSVNEARRLEGEGGVRICAPAEVREIRGDGSIQAVTVEDTGTGETFDLDCDALILLLGFHSHLGSIADWGLELHGKRQILVNPMTMDTSIPGVYAAGDVAGYEGKITLITIGFGEAAIAANNAIARIRGEKVQPKYSTD